MAQMNMAFDLNAQLAGQYDLQKVELSALPLDEFGKGMDLSDTTAINPLMKQFGLVNALLQNSKFIKDMNARLNPVTGKYEIVLPAYYWTEVPDAIGLDCCWTVPDLQACRDVVTIDYLCLKDCETAEQRLWRQNMTVNSVDVQTVWGKTGTIIDDARVEYMLDWMMSLSARTIVLGQPGITTDIIKPFNGMLSYMSSANTFAIEGTNLYAALAQLQCRIDFLRMQKPSSNFQIFGNMLTLKSFDELHSELGDRAGTFGLTKNGDSLSFNGIPFVAEQNIPHDIEIGVGEVWVIDMDSVGLLLQHSLRPPKDTIREVETETLDIATGCMTVCRIIENWGGVYSRDFNRLAKIVNIPTARACAGNTLETLGTIVNPNTLIPNLG